MPRPSRIHASTQRDRLREVHRRQFPSGQHHVAPADQAVGVELDAARPAASQTCGGRRPLGEHAGESVELMTTDQLTEDPDKRFFVSPGFWRGAGFGLGLQITTQRLNLGPSVGSFWWHGATGVGWTVDPHEDMIFLRFVQHGGALSGLSDYMQAVYQAIVD